MTAEPLRPAMPRLRPATAADLPRVHALLTENRLPLDGVARALVARAIADAESRGAQALYLLTTTAEHYFPSFDFRPTARAAVPAEVRESVEFTSACPASAVVMVRERGDAAVTAAGDAA